MADTGKIVALINAFVGGLKSAVNQSKAPVILDNATGGIVTVPDGADGIKVETLTVAIEPKQDLHGQSNPYPAGGGNNKLASAAASSQTVDGITFACDGNGVYSISGTASASVNCDFSFADSQTLIANDKLSFFNTFTGYNLFFRYENEDKCYWNLSSTNRTATIASADAKTFDSIRVIIPSGSTVNGKFALMMYTGDTATQFEPYANICPISGWSAAEVTRTGFNLLDEVFESGGLTWASGEPVAGTDRIRTKNFNPIKPSTDYYTMRGLDYAYLFLYDKNKTFIEQYLMTDTVITTPNNAYWFKVVIMETAYKNEVSVNYPSTDHNHHPYAGGQTKTYTFPAGVGTVYGGTLTVNADGTGKLVVDRASVDMGSLNWTYINTSDIVKGFWVFKLDMLEGITYPPVISSMYKTAGILWANISDKQIGTNATGSPERSTAQIIVKDSAYSDVQTFTAGVTGQTIVYTLATPITYNLTNLDVITLLKGNNNLWADCGGVSMQYPCDTKLFIERLTAPTEDDMVANSNITSGKFFMVGNDMYLSTSAIAQGAAIVPGTNCTKVSIADALNTINA